LVKFDVNSDGRFNDCLHDLSDDAELEILQAIHDIDLRQYTWDRFVHTHGWEPVPREGDNTYPGAHEIHYFYVQGQSGQLYEVFGYRYSDHTLEDILVVCAIARLA
jgi:hypothetical protein